jgi:hypothetical protein
MFSLPQPKCTINEPLLILNVAEPFAILEPLLPLLYPAPDPEVPTIDALVAHNVHRDEIWHGSRYGQPPRPARLHSIP